MKKKYYRMKELVEYIGISRAMLWKHVQSGNLKATRLSPRVTIFDIDDINCFIEESIEKHHDKF